MRAAAGTSSCTSRAAGQPAGVAGTVLRAAGAFVAATVFFAGALAAAFVAVFFADAFAAVLVAVDFAAVLVAVDFAVDFAAVDFAAVDFAGAFFAGALAAVFVALADFASAFAAAFFAGADFVVVFFAGAAFAALALVPIDAVLFAGAALAVAFFAGAALAVAFFAGAAFAAADATLAAGFLTVRADVDATVAGDVFAVDRVGICPPPRRPWLTTLNGLRESPSIRHAVRGRPASWGRPRSRDRREWTEPAEGNRGLPHSKSFPSGVPGETRPTR